MSEFSETPEPPLSRPHVSCAGCGLIYHAVELDARGLCDDCGALEISEAQTPTPTLESPPEA